MGPVARNMAALLSGAAVTILVGMHGAKAQEAKTNEAEKKGRVTLLQRIVLGAGAEKIAINTPQAVTVLDQEDIDRQQAETTGGLFKSVPGVTLVGSERVFGEAFNIRGIGSTENSADGSRIIVNVDGAQKFYEQYRMGSFFSDPELYKKVEVLRGPASSTLYGSGALGGVINFVTKDASDFLKDGKDNALRLKSSYESNGDGLLGSAIYARRLNDNFEVLATGNYRTSDEITLGNDSKLVGSDFKAWSGLLKGTARFGDNNEQTVRLSYQRWDSDADDQAYAQTGTQATFGLVDRHVVDSTAILSYENPISDNPWLDLKATLSYSDTTVEQRNGTLGGSNIINADYGYKTWQTNLQNTSELTGESYQNFLTYGVQASHQDRVGVSQLITGTGDAINTHPEGTDNKLGAFVQNEYVWNEKLTLIAGARGDFVWRQPGEDAETRGHATDVNDTAWSPKIAALYKFNDNFGVFGSIAHTERLPTLDELYTWSKGVSLDLEKEKSNNYEVGFTTSGNDILQDGDALSVKTTGFYNDLTDLIQLTATGASSYFYNVGKARIYGVEIEGAYDSDYVFANLAYTGVKGENQTPGLNYGKALSTIPAHKIVFSLGARVPDRDLEFGGRVTHAFKALNSIQGTASSSATPSAEVVPADAWTTVDLFASWKPQSGQFEGWQAQFGINNIFNAYYRDALALDYAKGRTFKLTLAKQLDW
ncbi:TonB-dependent receptor [Mesorhizobium sp. M00.F.Ca.ET.186.01.1.1]|nr:TonB-dependent receptor [bacterium M00.F.Ca.ET.205.01.1.1]TGU53131.1 TonB-dependent receptor [bacterium M00.F.Ca.ET.152.01.1.1]TGV36097.1 TonB-dependent receptor [Mesorhizobium sp. M00.F.Ca.ET.186.01.1.1]TGZ43684.1 TonB-dependent receptor [bacterium M00.F.Ca.ET.162.01.1.1]